MSKSQITLLVVDDQTIVRKGIRALLEQVDDIRVIGEAADGEEAVSQVNLLNPDVILMDLMMPKKDGFSVLAEMKAKKVKTPVIVLSNLGQQGDMKKATELGAAAYFVKSDTPIAEVVAHAKKILGA